MNCMFSHVCVYKSTSSSFLFDGYLSAALDHIHWLPAVLSSSLQDVLNNLGSSELDEDDLMLDMDLSDDQRHRHGNFSML